MDASGGSSPPQENPPKHGGGGRGKAPAVEIRGEAADDFLFADDTFPSLPDFPCLSSPSSSTFSSSSSSNSSSAFTAAAGGGGRGRGEPSEPATAADGLDALADIDQLLDFASLSVPSWDDEPLFPDVGMMIEDDISEQPPPVGHGRADCRAAGKAVLEAADGEEGFMGASAADDLPRFFMEWLRNNRDCISAEDLRSIRLRRSTIEAAAARLGGGRQGTMQLLKLILTWVQNHHLQKKRPRDAMEAETVPHAPCHGQLPSPGANAGYEFPAGGQEMGAAATSWMPYQAFTPPAYGGEAIYPNAGPYPFQQSCSTSSVVVNSQPFSPPAVADMHAVGGGSMAWLQQYASFPAAASTGSYPVPPPPVVVTQPVAPGFTGQYPAGGGHPTMCPQPMAGMEPSATKEARKKRMARQRRLSCLQQQRSQQLNLSRIQSGSHMHPQDHSPRPAHSSPVTPPSGGCHSCGLWSPPASGVQVQVQNPLSSKPNSSMPPNAKQPKPSPETTATKPAAALSVQHQDGSPQRSAATSDKRSQGARSADKNLRFLLQKVLKQSDVGSLGRIVLPKKEAETHLPELKTGDGISIPMEDIGTSRVWNMRYRFWPNNKSRMYLLENTGDFIRSNELQEGDFIVIYSDVKSGKYLTFCIPHQLIRGVKVRPTKEQGKHKHGCSEKGGGSDAKAGGEDGGTDAGGGCKGKSPHGVRRSHQEATSMNQMAVSI